MNVTLLAAGLLMLAIALVHTLVGERMIFRPWRRGDPPAQPLRRYRGILRGTWHLASALGAGVGMAWITLARHGHAEGEPLLLVRGLALATLAGAVLVCVGTRGRHPGWIGLGLAAALAWIG